MGKYFLHLDAPFVLLLLAEEKNPGAHYELWRSYGYDGIMWPYVSSWQNTTSDAHFHIIASRSAVVEQNFDTPNQDFMSLPCTTFR